MSNNNVSENPLFNYLIEKLPFLNNPELIKLLKSYSTLLKRYLSSPISPRSYSSTKTELRNCLNEIYKLVNSTTNLIESETLGFKRIINTVGSNTFEKHVYYTANRIIKKNKHSKRENLPYLLNEAIINIVLEYICMTNDRIDVPQFRRFTQVRETNNSESSRINYNYEMEKIQGITLHDYILSKDFNIKVLRNILHQIIEILTFLQNTCGFFHGDLNTSNIMLIKQSKKKNLNEEEINEEEINEEEINEEEINGKKKFDKEYKVKLIDFGFSLIDTNYLNNQTKYVLTNTRSLNTDRLFIDFTSNGNLNRESKKNLKYIDFYHLLFFV